MRLENSSFFDRFVRNIKKQKSFTLTGLTTFSRLLLVKYIQEISNKKILFLTSTEQAALRYSVDFEKIWDIETAIFPYQNISPYETMRGHIYDYQKQVEILKNRPNLVIVPIKATLEKFPNEEFLENNSLCLKIGDNISTVIETVNRLKTPTDQQKALNRDVFYKEGVNGVKELFAQYFARVKVETLE